MASSSNKRARPRHTNRESSRWSRFWPVASAGLALVAALWAAFVGQTIPELLRDDKAHLHEFRSSVTALCNEPHIRAAMQNTAQRTSDYNLNSLVTFAEGVYPVLPKLADIDAPSQYVHDYAVFKHAMLSVYSEASHAAGYYPDIALRRRPDIQFRPLIGMYKRAMDSAMSGTRSAVMLGLTPCWKALSWATNFTLNRMISLTAEREVRRQRGITVPFNATTAP